MVYIETFRNIPLLLQILFWYFIVLNKLPLPRQSMNLADVFLSINGDSIFLHRFSNLALGGRGCHPGGDCCGDFYRPLGACASGADR